MGQHRGQGQAALLRNRAGHDAVKPSAGVGAFDKVFAEVLQFVQAHALTNGHDFLAGGFPCVGAAEGGFFIARLAGQGVVVHHLKPVLLAPNSVHAVKHLIHRRGAEGAGCRALFVRVADREAHLVVFDDLRDGVAGRGPGAKARDVKAARVAFDLAVDHPLCQGKAHAAALREARHHGAGRPVVAQALNRADQRVAVRGKGEGAVDHALDA